MGRVYAELATGDQTATGSGARSLHEGALCLHRCNCTAMFARGNIGLGGVYAQLGAGDRRANLEKAIACYEEALLFTSKPKLTPLVAKAQMGSSGLWPMRRWLRAIARLIWSRRFHATRRRCVSPRSRVDPANYAGIQVNRANAYVARLTGSRAANLGQAIACFEEAMRFFPIETAPYRYGETQLGLGDAYAGLPTGDLAANLEQAIACYGVAAVFDGRKCPPAVCQGARQLGRCLRKTSWRERRRRIFEQAIICSEKRLKFSSPRRMRGIAPAARPT